MLVRPAIWGVGARCRGGRLRRRCPCAVEKSRRVRGRAGMDGGVRWRAEVDGIWRRYEGRASVAS